ncbi:hypothetical protein BJ508DRAFT_324897 [Ascobolus immersus RN42]|uniref:Uncharacterized protein n=1 Tax=Ascobolus immersus RN42 TaxID=1160509 RepID=A0A3N4IC30_ASCIM|nr:hypothetical protein BJ508DRAFT_324897 [Ascobolus immersus RN42]
MERQLPADTKVYFQISQQVKDLIAQEELNDAIHICNQLLDRPTIPLFFDAWFHLLKGAALIRKGEVGYCPARTAFRRSLELWRECFEPGESNDLADWVEDQLEVLEPEVEDLLSRMVGHPVKFDPESGDILPMEIGSTAQSDLEGLEEPLDTSIEHDSQC